MRTTKKIHKKLFALITGFLIHSGIAYAGDFPPESSALAYKEADTHFTYHGKAINPRILKLFDGWESDTGVPTVVTVDIAAAYDTNQFSDEDVAYQASGATLTEKPETDEPATVTSYRWIGRTPNGLHVVEVTTSGGGGSMIASHLLFLRFTEGKGWRPSAISKTEDYPTRLIESEGSTEQSYSRLLMSIERYYIIGDRVGAEYNLKGNDIIVKLGERGKVVTKTIHTD